MSDLQVDEDVAVGPPGSDRENSPLTVVTAVEQNALDLPTEPCGHCWIHSQPSSGTSTLAAVNPSPPPVEALAPPAKIAIDLAFPNATAIEPLEHGPPGSSFPRHILNNVSRI